MRATRCTHHLEEGIWRPSGLRRRSAGGFGLRGGCILVGHVWEGGGGSGMGIGGVQNFGEGLEDRAGVRFSVLVCAAEIS
jgi:hypothetical protein